MITPESEKAKYVACYMQERYARELELSGKSPLVPILAQIPDQCGSYADVGHGRGKCIRWIRANRKDLTVTGTEFGAPLLPEYDTKQYRLPEAWPFDGPKDFVTCFEVLEHLPVHDVIPALRILFQNTRHMLIFSTNDQRAAGADSIGLTLHLSRFPLKWWLNTLDKLCEQHNARCTFTQMARERKRRWCFTINFNKSYRPIPRAEISWNGEPDTELWFWYCPEFPLAEVMKLPPSTPEVLADPAVIALRKDLDARGIKNPLLLHNIPGQPARRYWTRCGNHRRNWALDRGLATVPAIVYGGCEFEPCKPVTAAQAAAYLKDGRLTFNDQHPPNIVGIMDWQHGQYPESYNIGPATQLPPVLPSQI